MSKQDILTAAKAAVVQPDLPVQPDSQSLAQTIKQTQALLEAEDAILISHYYTSPALQMLTEACGGFIGDSLEMAKYGKQHRASTVCVAGVRFMGETAKILSPHKRIIMPNLAADCSLDISCPPAAFANAIAQHPDRTVVVYANTSAEVKALADWVVTSSIAESVIEHLDSSGQKIFWAPDKHLGSYLQQKTGADMILWDGACIVHETFKANALMALQQQHPEAAILVHPEAPAEVVAMADVVGSTSQLLHASQSLPNETLIVATERGIFYKMQQASPEKSFLQAPSGGVSATCQSCIHCPWMAMNEVPALQQALRSPDTHEIHVSESVINKARHSLDRMMQFKSDSSLHR